MPWSQLDSLTKFFNYAITLAGYICALLIAYHSIWHMILWVMR